MEKTPSTTRNSSLFEWNFLENAGSFFLIGIPALLLLGLAIPNLAGSYWQDEVFSVTASRSLSGLFRMFREQENNMSLYQVILYFWMRLFGESETATHALSLLGALITLPLFYQLERKWFNKTTSFFGLLLLTVSPLFSYDAVETRSYGMLILCVTLSTLLFIKLLRAPRYGLAAAYGLVVGLSAYIHYFGVLIPMVHFFLLTRKTLTKKYIAVWICAAVVATIVISPLVLFPPKNKSQVAWITRPYLQDLWYVFSYLFGSGYVIVIMTLCVLLIFIKGFWKREPGYKYEPEKLAAVWAIGPVLLLYGFSIFIKPLFIIRFFAWIVPGATLFTTLVIGYTTRNRTVRTVLWFLVLGIFTVKSVLNFRKKGAGFKDSVQFIHQQLKPGDEVIVYPYFWALDVNYYLDRTGEKQPDARPVPITDSAYLGGGGGVDPDPALQAVRTAAAKGGKVYLVCSGNARLSPGDTSQKRIWLPEIRKILTATHPDQKEIIFGEETQTPVRVVVFE